MGDTESDSTRLECRDCSFGRTVDDSAERTPAELIVEHGRERGHTVEINPED